MVEKKLACMGGLLYYAKEAGLSPYSKQEISLTCK